MLHFLRFLVIYSLLLRMKQSSSIYFLSKFFSVWLCWAMVRKGHITRVWTACAPSAVSLLIKVACFHRSTTWKFYILCDTGSICCFHFTSQLHSHQSGTIISLPVNMPLVLIGYYSWWVTIFGMFFGGRNLWLASIGITATERRQWEGNRPSAFCRTVVGLVSSKVSWKSDTC